MSDNTLLGGLTEIDLSVLEQVQAGIAGEEVEISTPLLAESMKNVRFRDALMFIFFNHTVDEMKEVDDAVSFTDKFFARIKAAGPMEYEVAKSKSLYYNAMVGDLAVEGYEDPARILISVNCICGYYSDPREGAKNFWLEQIATAIIPENIGLIAGFIAYVATEPKEE